MPVICSFRSFALKHTCSWSALNKYSSTMEGIVTTSSGKRRPIVSPLKGSPPKKLQFTGITPLKSVNFNTEEKRPFKVSIEGNIGAGKSTLIKHFQKTPNVETFAEPIEWWRNVHGHNLLELLYKDINQWIFTFQNYVLLSRLKIQTTPPKSPDTSVMMFERSVQNNRFCFLESVHEAGTLHSSDYTILDQWYRWIRESVDIRLDLIVYLRTSPEVVYERMKARGRPEESTVSLEYLKQLHESHEKWLMTNDERFNNVPVVVLDADLPLYELIALYKQNENIILGRKQTNQENAEEKENVKQHLKF